SRSVRASAMRSACSARCGPRPQRPVRLGPQYIADAWINEVKWLGSRSALRTSASPSASASPSGFMRTLKEQSLYLHRFRDLEGTRVTIGEFIARYDTEWLIQRLGHRTPAQARADAQRQAA